MSVSSLLRKIETPIPLDGDLIPDTVDLNISKYNEYPVRYLTSRVDLGSQELLDVVEFHQLPAMQELLDKVSFDRYMESLSTINMLKSQDTYSEITLNYLIHLYISDNSFCSSSEVEQKVISLRSALPEDCRHNRDLKDQLIDQYRLSDQSHKVLQKLTLSSVSSIY